MSLRLLLSLEGRGRERARHLDRPTDLTLTSELETLVPNLKSSSLPASLPGPPPVRGTKDCARSGAAEEEKASAGEEESAVAW